MFFCSSVLYFLVNVFLLYIAYVEENKLCYVRSKKINSLSQLPLAKKLCAVLFFFFFFFFYKNKLRPIQFFFFFFFN